MDRRPPLTILLQTLREARERQEQSLRTNPRGNERIPNAPRDARPMNAPR